MGHVSILLDEMGLDEMGINRGWRGNLMHGDHIKFSPL